ncbi:MAG: Rid family detoxifying hydrolase [Candidatus Cloacimonetes bacterium]|nr:Rid family detoxifying hydrolase [Candidatus Cloacimonadota bacterium]
MREIITPKAPEALGPYSQAVEKNGWIFVSGQIGINPGTGNLALDFDSQIKQVFQNIDSILEAAGVSKHNIVKVSIFLADINDFAQLNVLYHEWLKAPFPAREAIEVAELPRNAKIEISVIASR